MDQNTLTMISARVSPMVEMARWLLERKGTAYTEQAHVPVLHLLATLRVRGGVEVPVVLGPDIKWRGARETLQGLDADCSLFGTSDAERSSNLALASTLLHGLLQTVRRYVYHQMLPFKTVLLPIVTEGAPAWECGFVRWMYPVWRWAMGKALGFAPDLLAEAPLKIEEMLTLVERELDRRGTPFLDGVKPGTLDIVFSALVAPIVFPSEYGSRLPRLDQLPPTLREFVEKTRGRRAGKLVLRTYELARTV